MSRRHCQDYTDLANQIDAREEAEVEERFRDALKALPLLVFTTTILLCALLGV